MDQTETSIREPVSGTATYPLGATDAFQQAAHTKEADRPVKAKMISTTDRWSFPRIGLLCASLFVLAQLGGCGDSPEQPGVSNPIRPVKTLVVSAPNKNKSIELSGDVQVPEPVELAFEGVSGTIVELPIAGREGQAVMKGELLAQIDPADFEAALRNAEDKLQKAYTALDSARAESERMGKMRRITPDLVTDSMLERSQRQLSEAEAEIESSEAKVRKAEGLLEQSSLRAPFAGLLVRCMVKPSQAVRASEPILSLQDMTHLDVAIGVSEQVLAAARAPGPDGLSAVVRFPTIPSKAFPLQMTTAASAQDPATGDYRVLFQMDKPDGTDLPEGTIGTVILTGKGRDLGVGNLLIPAIAVMTDADGKDYVWILDETDMRVHRRDVRMGRLVGSDQVQLISGLAGGERIVTAGVTRLTEGQQVRLWEPEEADKAE